MATTTIRVSTETHDLLSRLARTSGTSMQHVLDVALEQYRRRQFLETLNAAYEAARADQKAEGEAAEERAVWDATLLDGLDNDGDRHEP